MEMPHVLHMAWEGKARLCFVPLKEKDIKIIFIIHWQ